MTLSKSFHDWFRLVQSIDFDQWWLSYRRNCHVVSPCVCNLACSVVLEEKCNFGSTMKRSLFNFGITHTATTAKKPKKSDCAAKVRTNLTKTVALKKTEFEEIPEAHSPSTSSSAPTPSSSVKSKGKSKAIVFQQRWLQKWLWLENRDDGMRCTLCAKHKKINAFTSQGCVNYRTSTLQQSCQRGWSSPSLSLSRNLFTSDCHCITDVQFPGSLNNRAVSGIVLTLCYHKELWFVSRSWTLVDLKLN